MHDELELLLHDENEDVEELEVDEEISREEQLETCELDEELDEEDEELELQL